MAVRGSIVCGHAYAVLLARRDGNLLLANPSGFNRVAALHGREERNSAVFWLHGEHAAALVGTVIAGRLPGP